MSSISSRQAAGTSSASTLTPTATKTAAYTASVGDLAMMNAAGGGTALTLPTAPADKAQVGYRAIGATSSVPLVISAGGSDTIGTSGATTASIPLADEVGVLQYQASSSRWLAVANVKTQASLDARYPSSSSLAGLPPLGGWWAAAFSGLPLGRTVLGSAGGITGVAIHTLARDVTNLRMVAPYGWNLSTTSAEVVSPTGIPVKVALRVVGAASMRPVTWGGLRTRTLDSGAGGPLVSDPLGGVWAKGTQIEVRTYLGIASGETYPKGLAASGPGSPVGASVGFTSGSDVTDVTTAPTGASTTDDYFTPLLLGVPTSRSGLLVLGGMGDSIMFGTGDTGGTGFSWLTRATAGQVPLFRAAISGQMAQVAMAGIWQYTFFSSCTHVVVMLGTNDLQSNRTLTQIKGYLTTMYNALRAQGVKVLGATVLPKTTSTDNWATTAGQTASGADYTGGAGSVRAQLNAWIRAGADGLLAGYVETADAVETARDSGIWQVFGGRTVADAAITSGSGVLTSATAAFSAADVGRTVLIAGAGAAGAALTATITAYTNATTVTVSPTASTTVSGAVASISGGTIDGIHPSAQGHAAMAAAVNLTTIAAL